MFNKDALHGMEEEATDMDDLEPASSSSESETSGQVVLVSGRKLSDSNIPTHELTYQPPTGESTYKPAYANSNFYMKHKPETIPKPPNALIVNSSSSDSQIDIQDKVFLKQYKNEKSEGESQYNI